MKLQKILKNLPLVFILLNTNDQLLANHYITSSSGSANANAAYNAAKLNTAQVENQTSVDIGNGGMEVKVRGNTHLEGATISSQADKANNRFQTGGLTTSNLTNYSELETKSASISGGSSGINPLSALSLLGNKNESSQSTTKAAIGENIDITLTDDPNAETTLKNLNRDTQNANQKVAKHDLSKVKETQELVKGIGEIADKAMQIYTHNEREEIEQAKLALGKAKQQAKERGVPNSEMENDPQVKLATKVLVDKQQAYDKEYGTGSKMKQAVDAVTAALQGLAAKDLGQAAVGLASPYLNAQIKQHTTNADGSINTEANLLAHALLGAVEAVATGNNALAGAVAGAGGEAAAMAITHALYPNKTADQLTEVEKKNITFLSQLAGGLASGLVGDSTQAAALGADVARRAVGNNFLKDKARETLDNLIEIYYKTGKLSANQIKQARYLMGKDQKTDELLYKYQTGKKLSQDELTYLELNAKEFTRGYNEDLVKRLDNYFISPKIFSQNTEFLSYLDKHTPVDWKVVALQLSDAALSLRGGKGTQGGKLKVNYQGQSTSFTINVPHRISAKDRQITIGQLKNYELSDIKFKGVTLNDFKGANKESLQRFNQFLSNTAETTTGKGTRNATKPSGVSIESDWLNLTKGSQVTEYPNGRKVAKFKTGEQAVFRPSKTGPMTIELQRPDSKKIIEVRYDK